MVVIEEWPEALGRATLAEVAVFCPPALGVGPAGYRDRPIFGPDSGADIPARDAGTDPAKRFFGHRALP